jgi:IS5 family transposase
MQALQRMTARQREQQQTPQYRQLIRITEQVAKNAKQVIAAAKRIRRLDAITRAAMEETYKQINSFCQLGKRVIDQTRRRVLQGETVPSEEKLYSIFEPHTDLINQAGQDAEAGGIRSQGFPGRERPGLDHRLPRAGGQPG